jgi:type II secretion system protein N
VRLLRILGYVAFGLFSFVVCAYLTFPWNALKDRVLTAASTQTGWQLTARAMQPSWFTGVVLTEVEATPPGGGAPVEIARLVARASLWSLLTGGRGLRAQFEIGRGSVDVDVSQTSDSLSVDGTMEGVEAALVGDMKALTGLPLLGSLGADIDVRLDLEDPTKSEGTIELTGTELELGKGGQVKGIPVPELSLGSLDWNLEIAGGQVRFEQERLSGGELTATVDGAITLAKPFERSTLNLSASMEPTEALVQRAPLTSILKNRFVITGSIKHPRAVPRR